MALTNPIDAEIAGHAANCYVALDEVNDYFAHRLEWEEWSAFASDRQRRAIVSATQMVERLSLAGTPWSKTQSLHFPTTEDVDDAGKPYIPKQVRHAVCEQALWLLQQHDAPELLDRATLQAQGVASVSVDGISETYAGNGAMDGLCGAAKKLLSSYTASAGRVTTVTVAPRFGRTAD